MSQDENLAAVVTHAASDIGSFIRAQREAAQVSVRQLAEKAGVSNPYLSQIERGLRKPSAEVLNQIAKAANDGGRVPGSAREEFRAMLKVCEALRDNTKALLKANLTSWECGHGEDI